jgi:hypothetical protein
MFRSLLHRALETKRGDSFALIRAPKQILRGVNDLLGGPLSPKVNTAPVEQPVVKREPAPVMVYREGDRNLRERMRIEDALKARDIQYKLLDVSGDPTTKAFVVQAAGCEEDDLPVVFVGGTVVGTFNELVQWDVSGRLMREVFGA